MPFGTHGLTQAYRSSKNNAKSRNLSYELSRQEFENLVLTKNCFYCNVKLSIDTGNITKVSGFTPEYIKHHTFGPHFGIDRIDSNIGYKINNCVTCCKQCNYGKLDQTIKEWIEYISRFNAQKAEEINNKLKEKVCQKEIQV